MQKNKPIYIVTGATGGIGKEIAYSLAKEGKCVVLACRDTSKAEFLKKELIAKTGNQEIEVELLDLSSFNSIRDFANRMSRLALNIHALINNAGIMCRRYSLTVDNVEETMAVNYFGTVLLTKLLLPKIENGGKILFTTSITRKLHQLNNNTLAVSSKNFSQLGTYGRSKSAITHYSLYLAKEVHDRNITVVCSDPGIVNSGMIKMNRWFDPLANYLFRPFISNASRGAKVALHAITKSESGYIYTQKRKIKICSKNSIQEHQIVVETHSILKLKE